MDIDEWADLIDFGFVETQVEGEKEEVVQEAAIDELFSTHADELFD